MNISAGPPVEPLHDQKEKGSRASGAVAHRSTPGTIARVGPIGRRIDRLLGTYRLRRFSANFQRDLQADAVMIVCAEDVSAAVE